MKALGALATLLDRFRHCRRFFRFFLFFRFRPRYISSTRCDTTHQNSDHFRSFASNGFIAAGITGKERGGGCSRRAYGMSVMNGSEGGSGLSFVAPKGKEKVDSISASSNRKYVRSSLQTETSSRTRAAWRQEKK